jgi:hypothetical protein
MSREGQGGQRDWLERLGAGKFSMLERSLSVKKQLSKYSLPISDSYLGEGILGQMSQKT